MPSSKHGFTLIELLVVIALIGVLATITISAYNSAQQKARDGVRKSDLTQIKKALEFAKSDCQGSAYYPVVAGNTEYDRFENLKIYLSHSNLNYMKPVPDDPKNAAVGPDTYKYAYNTVTTPSPTLNVCQNTTGPSMTQSGSTDFMIRALLERGTTDPDSAKTFAQCAGKPGMPAQAGGYYYVCNN